MYNLKGGRKQESDKNLIEVKKGEKEFLNHDKNTFYIFPKKKSRLVLKVAISD